MVTTAWTMRLSYSRVSIRSEFQISDRSVTLIVGDTVPDFLDQLGAALLEHLAGAEHRAIGLHDLLHVEAELRGRRAAVGVAVVVEPLEGKLTGIGRQFRMRLTRLDGLGAFDAPPRGRRRPGR